MTRTTDDPENVLPRRRALQALGALGLAGCSSDAASGAALDTDDGAQDSGGSGEAPGAGPGANDEGGEGAAASDPSQPTVNGDSTSSEAAADEDTALSPGEEPSGGSDPEGSDEGQGSSDPGEALTEDELPPDTCVLTPAQAEGPFFFDTQLQRSDIRDGKPGTELSLSLRLLDASDCSPIEGAVVELWHCDAEGVYSAFDAAQGNSANAAGETFLRGFQTSNANGRVEFRTIYPGWYPGRTVHVHAMVVIGGNRMLTTQLYFPEPLTAEVYGSAPYAARGLPDTSNAADGLTPGGAGLQVLLVNATPNAGIYVGRLDVAVDLS